MDERESRKQKIIQNQTVLQGKQIDKLKEIAESIKIPENMGDGSFSMEGMAKVLAKSELLTAINSGVVNKVVSTRNLRAKRMETLQGDEYGNAISQAYTIVGNAFDEAVKVPVKQEEKSFAEKVVNPKDLNSALHL